MAFFIVGDIFEVVHMWIATFYQVLGNSRFFFNNFSILWSNFSKWF